MFKLKKILGAKNSVPEIRMWDNDATCFIQAGYIYVLRDGTLTTELENTLSNYRKVIPIMSMSDSESQEPIAGYLVTSDMVFEVDLDKNATHLNVGDYVMVVSSSDGNRGYVKAANEELRDAVVISNYNISNRKVDVVFI